jgi:hypothetical protein
MNNDLYIILLPVLPAVVVGVYAVAITVLYVREKLKRKDEQAYQALSESYVDDMAQLAIAEAELERLQTQTATLTTLKANFDQENVRLQGLLADTRKQRDELNRENDKLHVREKLLIDAMNKQQVEAPVPGVSSEFLNKLEAHVEKGKVDGDTVATTVTQDSAPTRPARKRKAT